MKFTWKDNQLFLCGEPSAKILEVIPDARHPSQWRILWPNGDLSTDFYNYSRVKDNAIKITIEEMNKTTEDGLLDVVLLP